MSNHDKTHAIFLKKKQDNNLILHYLLQQNDSANWGFETTEPQPTLTPQS